MKQIRRVFLGSLAKLVGLLVAGCGPDIAAMYGPAPEYGPPVVMYGPAPAYGVPVGTQLSGLVRALATRIGIAAIQVRLLDAEGRELASTVTGEDGSYSVTVGDATLVASVQCTDIDGEANGTYTARTVQVTELTSNTLPTVELEAA